MSLYWIISDQNVCFPGINCLFPGVTLYKERLYNHARFSIKGVLDNQWHEVAYPVIIFKSYDHFGTVVHSQMLHIEITTGCWYSPLEIDHSESRQLAVLFTDTLILQLASKIMSSDMINLFSSSVKTIWLSRAYLIVYIPHTEHFAQLITLLPFSDLLSH